MENIKIADVAKAWRDHYGLDHFVPELAHAVGQTAGDM